jgi:ATP-dependent Clp protease ATP-binding subunit ClpC
MFERYTENARQVIFFAREQASRFGSSCIESEHLLLGTMRSWELEPNELLKLKELESALSCCRN